MFQDRLFHCLVMTLTNNFNCYSDKVLCEGVNRSPFLTESNCSFICLGSVLIKLRLTTVLLCLQKLLTIGVSMVVSWHPTGTVD